MSSHHDAHDAALALWWAEDAERYNALGELLRARGQTVSLGLTDWEPPGPLVSGPGAREESST